ncbi:hypothetical protein M0804_014705 [Polistes exclamans]|nr:hypothetical protein M0804_014706 [Polistes exclamans]KAI4474724.1 hypothetical protein M0804_014705 [Polistes exclamans]
MSPAEDHFPEGRKEPITATSYLLY